MPDDYFSDDDTSPFLRKWMLDPPGLDPFAAGGMQSPGLPAPQLGYDLNALTSDVQDASSLPAPPAPATGLSRWRVDPPINSTPPAGHQCPLVPPNLPLGTIAPTNADLRFSPRFVSIFDAAARDLADQGVQMHVHSAFRTATEQAAMRNGGSGSNPAAHYSDHQLGNAVDIDGTRGPNFPAVVDAFTKAGAHWGAQFNDRPHFYIRPMRANATNTAECERENPPQANRPRAGRGLLGKFGKP